MYTINISDKVIDKDVALLPPEIKIKVNEAAEHLRVNFAASVPLKRPLRGYFKFKLGKHYRLIYTIDHKRKNILVVGIGHRGWVYKEKI